MKIATFDLAARSMKMSQKNDKKRNRKIGIHQLFYPTLNSRTVSPHLPIKFNKKVLVIETKLNRK